MASGYKLPSWVSTKERGFFKDEVIKKIGAQQSVCTSWLSSWKPKDENSKIHFSYIKKNGDEYVAKSKAFLTAELQPSKKKCIICNKKFIIPAWVCFTYKFKEGITREKIYESRYLACVYHFECKGIFKRGSQVYGDEYEETDDFNESEFNETFESS